MNYSKSIKRELRKLSALAYERELSSELTKLAEQFELWQKDEIDPFELVERIHQFHNGASRDLYKYYVMSSSDDFTVVRGLTLGFLTNGEISDELQEKLAPLSTRFSETSS